MGSINSRPDYVFHRDFKKNYHIISYGEGVYLYDDSGKKYLDASSGAISVNLGHGLAEIAEAMAEQAKKAAFVHTLRFETEVLHQLASIIGNMAPGDLNRVYFTTGGSEANESAIKLARQYHRDRGESERHIVIGRWQSYHGNTLGSLSAGGDVKRRKPYMPMLANFEHIHSPYCLRCPYNKSFTSCQRQQGLYCIEALERLIVEIGPEFISSIICEPIVGSQQGAVVPPQGYFERMRDICDQYGILLIIDEVMTGFGRAGTNFAIESFGIDPDIITFGKGVSGGYAPLAGMVVADSIIENLIENGDGKFIHGYTYSGHPVAVAAGLAAMNYFQKNNILDNCNKQSLYLFDRLNHLKEKHKTIGQIRGRGLLIGFEVMLDRNQDKMFHPSYGAAERINQIATELGAIFYPGSGTIDGTRGDHMLVGPPLTIQEKEIDELIEILDKAITRFEKQVEQDVQEGRYV
jgi:adenosylmethionine-8-amino-7-oxononanoate aminotransferase